MPKGKRITDFTAANYAQIQYKREREKWHELINLKRLMPLELPVDLIQIQQDRVLSAFHAYRILENHWKINL